MGGPMKSYVHCIRHNGYENMYGKTIANTFWLKKASNAHAFLYRCAAVLSAAAVRGCGPCDGRLAVALEPQLCSMSARVLALPNLTRRA